MSPELIISISTVIISIVSVFVAACALFVSLWSAHQTRKHNKLSVKPQLELVKELRATPPYYAILNSGLGPAIVRSITFMIKGHKFDGTSLKGWQQFNKQHSKSFKYAVGYLGKGAIMPAGSTEEIIALQKGSSKFTSQFLNFFTGSSIRIEYESIYGERFVNKRKL